MALGKGRVWEAMAPKPDLYSVHVLLIQVLFLWLALLVVMSIDCLSSPGKATIQAQQAAQHPALNSLKIHIFLSQAL